MSCDAIVTEVSMEPEDLSDFTLHFKDHAFHVHSQILSSASKYFRAAITAAKSESSESVKCSITSQCGRTGGMCLVSPEVPGGHETSVSDFCAFIKLLYNPEHLTLEDQPNIVPQFQISFQLANGGEEGVKFKISTENGGSISTMLTDGETEVTTNALLSQCGIVHFNVTTPSQSDILGSFVNTHILSMQLVHYFDCPSLSKALEHKSKVLMIRVS